MATFRVTTDKLDQYPARIKWLFIKLNLYYLSINRAMSEPLSEPFYVEYERYVWGIQSKSNHCLTRSPEKNPRLATPLLAKLPVLCLDSTDCPAVGLLVPSELSLEHLAFFHKLVRDIKLLQSITRKTKSGMGIDLIPRVAGVVEATSMPFSASLRKDGTRFSDNENQLLFTLSLLDDDQLLATQIKADNHVPFNTGKQTQITTWDSGPAQFVKIQDPAS